jgi:hypothetical protein
MPSCPGTCERSGRVSDESEEEGEGLIMVLPVCLTVVPKAAQVALGGQLAVSLTVQNTSEREACSGQSHLI